MSDMGGISGDRLKSFIERVERLEEEKAGIQGDIRDVYAEAKSTGFDTGIMRQIIRLRRLSPDERAEMEDLLDAYKAALGMLPFERTPLGEAVSSFQRMADEDGTTVSIRVGDGSRHVIAEPRSRAA